MTWTPECSWHYTTAIATEDFFQRKCIRLSRQHINEIQEVLKCDIASYSRSDHEDVEKWFKLLGFRLSHMDSGARVFVKHYDSDR